MSISPWAGSAELASPDGRWVAKIRDAYEIAMGGPTSGQLRISNGMVIESAHHSIAGLQDSMTMPLEIRSCPEVGPPMAIS